MWSPVLFVLLVASVRVDADADANADAEPFMTYVYPQFDYGNNWAGIHFGTPQETLEIKSTTKEEEVAYHPSFSFLPAMVAQSPFIAIRNVQAPPQHIVELQSPAETHNIQLLHHPAMFFGPALFPHTSHIRVPDHNQKDPIPVPVTAGPGLAFASHHTAQIPIFSGPPTLPNLFQPIPVHVPVAAPSFGIQHSAQVPIRSFAFGQKRDKEEEDEDDDDEKRVNLILVPHFPTELASLSTLRVAGDGVPPIPAGIVQSTQPIFRPFSNSKAHPDLLGKFHVTRDSSVIFA